ncbi:MAG: septum formation initiator family protein [Clostridiales bacterium]|nr:septum formation initiator family protein [Clostridiales bacterium]
MKKNRNEKKSNKKSDKKLFGGKNVFTIISGIFLLALFVVFGISTINQHKDISRLESQKEEISAEYEEQTQENKELQAVLDSDSLDDYIEQKAREKGYVKSNEIVFYDISSSK